MANESEHKRKYMSDSPQRTKETSPIANLLFNLVLPVFLLNKLSTRLGEDGPLYALIIALAFPIGFSIYDYVKLKKRNWIAILGIINLLMTGSMAIFTASPSWFIVKETALPLLFGLFIFGSIYTGTPFVEKLFLNEQLMDVTRIKESLSHFNATDLFTKHVRLSTIYFSLSFLLSAALNYYLAVDIFTPIDAALSKYDQSVLMNQQVADMTSRSYLVIMVPSILATFLVVFHFFHGIKKYARLGYKDILKEN